MSRSSRRSSRGTTLAELLVSMVVLGLFTGFVVAIVAPVLKAPSQEQTKVDTLQAATQGLYQIQRDVRMSDTSGVYACSASGGTYTCSQPSSSQVTTYLVLLTPISNGQLAWDTTGSTTRGLPAWQGAIAYWLKPNNSGSNDLEKAFVSTSLLGALGSGPVSGSLSSIFVTALQDALSAGGATVAHDVQSLSVSVNTSAHIVGLRIQALSANGPATNSTIFVSNTYARN